MLRIVRFLPLEGCFWRVGEEVDEMGWAEEWRGRSRVWEEGRERTDGVVGMEVVG